MNENPNGVNLLEAPLASRHVELDRHDHAGKSVLGWLMRSIPNLIVLASLVALGFWGHHTGWKLPKFATMTGTEAGGKDGWCEEHAVSESQCIECNPDLLTRVPTFGWCDIHGVFNCPWEHPEIAQVNPVPKVTPDDLKRASDALETHPPINSKKCTHYKRRIQFASEEAVNKAGVKTEPAYPATVTEAITANGEIGYDPNRVANLSTPVTGRVWKVYKELNQSAAEKEVLALVNSSEVSKAKTEFKSALAQLGLAMRDVARLKPLSGKSVAEAELQKAEAAQEQAQIRLADTEQALVNLGLPVQASNYWGLTADKIAADLHSLGLKGITLDADAPEGLMPVRATRSGILVARKVVEGDLVDPSKTLFVVADISHMTLTLNVRQEDAKRVRPYDETTRSLGHSVEFSQDGLKAKIKGTVISVSTAADEKTRTVQVRVDLKNDGQLRAGTFGSGSIILRTAENVVVVPSEAVQWEGDAFVVFVRDKNYDEPGAYKVFYTRVVRPGAIAGGNTEIIAGVLPGELVVKEGSGVLRSELLKNALGEG